MRQHRGDVDDDEQDVEREPQRDDGERFQDSDAEEEEGEDVWARLGLPRDRLDGFRSDDAVADRRTKCNAEHDEPERDDCRRSDQTFRSQNNAFREKLVFFGDGQ